MPKKQISSGTTHNLPSDLLKALYSDKVALVKWEDITPLARNEWICWVESVKKPKTRKEHVERVCSELKEGMRRPCCWMGCVHRTDKLISPSVQYILNKKFKSHMKTLKCDLCAVTVKGETFEQWMKNLMPHYMQAHADVMNDKSKTKDDQQKWMTENRMRFESV